MGALQRKGKEKKGKIIEIYIEKFFFGSQDKKIVLGSDRKQR
jgi:hypothetical protein